MNNTERKEKQILIQKLLEKKRLILEIKQNGIGDIDSLKTEIQELEEELKKEGITDTQSLKRKISVSSSNADNVQKNIQGVITQDAGMFGNIQGWLGGFLSINALSQALLGKTLTAFVGDIWGKIKGEWVNWLVTSSKVLGIAGVLFFFGYMFYKIYKRLVDRAKKSISDKNSRNATREELNAIFNTNSILTESKQELKEMISENKQEAFVDTIISVCQDTLDILGGVGVIGVTIWVTLTVSLSPIIFIAATGATLWVLLLITRNALQRRKQYNNKQFRNTQQPQTNNI